MMAACPVEISSYSSVDHWVINTLAEESLPSSVPFTFPLSHQNLSSLWFIGALAFTLDCTMHANLLGHVD